MQQIYFDYHATTPLAPEVRDAMLEWMGEKFGNPHAANLFGSRAADAVEGARMQIAALAGCRRTDIIFTSGATEAANSALLGIAPYLKAKGRTRIVTLATEHQAVLQPLKRLEAEGFEVVKLGIKPDGLLDMKTLTQYADAKLGLVAVMHSHNEIGVVQDIANIAKIAHAHGALIFSDMTQSLGKIPINLKAMAIDMACFSAHKIYGPMGIGALYCRTQQHLTPLILGGGQEKNLRSGTLPVFLAAGFGKAAEIAEKKMPDEMLRIAAMRDRLLAELQKIFPDMIVNGSLTNRLAGNLHLTFPNISSEKLQNSLPEIQFSTGSACSSHNQHAADDGTSHLLRAFGYAEGGHEAHIRLSVGRPTTEDEIALAVSLFQERLGRK